MPMKVKGPNGRLMDLQQLEMMLSAAPGQLLRELPKPTTSVLEFADELYGKSLPTPRQEVDSRQSPYERLLERIHTHYPCTRLDAEVLFEMLTLVRVVTGSMTRRYIDWCHKVAAIAASREVIVPTSPICASLAICAPTYVQFEKGVKALCKFLGTPIPHSSWTDVDDAGCVVDVRKLIYRQVPLLPVAMPRSNAESEILDAIVKALDQVGGLDVRARLGIECGRGRLGTLDVIRHLQMSSVAMVVIYDWGDIHCKGEDLWKIAYALRLAGIVPVLVASGAIADCEGSAEFRRAFPANVIEIGPIDQDDAANVAKCLVNTLELDESLLDPLTEMIGSLYGRRDLVDAAAGLIARGIHVEGLQPKKVIGDVASTIRQEYSGALVAFEMMCQNGQVTRPLLAQFRDALPLALARRR